MNIEQLAANTIRALSMDAVQKANSGHPGAPMGMADMAVVLWSKFLRVDPTNPTWENRDRFVLSNGHASMMLYSILHLTGFPITIEDIKSIPAVGLGHARPPRARQFPAGSRRPRGHSARDSPPALGWPLPKPSSMSGFGPEFDRPSHIRDLSLTVMSWKVCRRGRLSGRPPRVGQAHLPLRRQRDHAGRAQVVELQRGRRRSGSMPTDGRRSQSTVTTRRRSPRQSLRALADKERPSLIACKTHIGFGSPHKQDSASAHGSPLGEEEVKLTKEAMGWDYEPFHVPAEVYTFFATAR